MNFNLQYSRMCSSDLLNNPRGHSARAGFPLGWWWVAKPREVLGFTRGRVARQWRGSRWGLGAAAGGLAAQHTTSLMVCLQELGELWGLTWQPLCVLCKRNLEAGLGERNMTAAVMDVIGGTKKGVHQRGLCQQLNFLYFRTGSYLNYFIDFLFPCKSSLSPGWTAALS